MFDLRYHVASLAAVFLALLIGILVGVGISGKADETQKDELRREVARLEDDLESAVERRANLERGQQAAQDYAEAVYPLLVANRLRGRQIAVVFIGSVNNEELRRVERTLDDAGAPAPLRMRALKLPIDPGKIDGALAGRAELLTYTGADRLPDLGRVLGRELVAGGEAPAWDALTSQLVEESSGSLRRTADGIVVVRTVEPQRGETARFLRGLYSGLAASGVPAVGVEPSTENPSAVEAWDRGGLSTVDNVDRPAGRLALTLLLAGGQRGNYGLKETADGVLPPIEPLPAEAG